MDIDVDSLITTYTIQRRRDATGEDRLEKI